MAAIVEHASEFLPRVCSNRVVPVAQESSTRCRLSGTQTADGTSEAFQSEDSVLTRNNGERRLQLGDRQGSYDYARSGSKGDEF